MRTTTRIPAKHQPEGRRFGTDPDSRPPMRPRDAYLAILVVVISALCAISLVSGVTTLAMHADKIAAEAIAAEDAKRSAEGAAK